MASAWQWYVVILGLEVNLVAAKCVAADIPYVPAITEAEVEISPDTYLRVRRRDWTVDDPMNTAGIERTEMQFQYRDATVKWSAVDIPVVLREKNATLYMVGYDRETGRNKKTDIVYFNYYRLDGNEFRRINKDLFPRDIATQNMFIPDHAQTLAAVLQMDTGNPLFQSSINACIWRHLMTGIESDDPWHDKAMMDNYMDRFKPTRLTRIRR